MPYSNYPQSATNAAKKALQHKEDNGSKCGTSVGWTSIAARSSYYTTMRNVLAMSPNEIRIKENMNPYAGGDSYELPLASNIKIEPTTDAI